MPAFAFALALSGVAAATPAAIDDAARACPGPTPLGVGTPEDIVSGVNAQHNEVFWATQDLHSPAKMTFDFNTTPAVMSAFPSLLLIGVRPDGEPFFFSVPTSYQTSSSPASITSPIGSVAWVPDAHSYHLTVDAPGTVAADLWFTGHPGGAMLPAPWDDEQVTWIQSLGTASVNGWIRFPEVAPQPGPYPPLGPGPGTSNVVEVHDWGGAQETMFGKWKIGPGPNEGLPVHDPAAPPTHVGYDYALSDNPDGSGDILYVFPQLCGEIRGLMSHTTADGEVSVCEPEVTFSDWTTELGFHTWQTMSGTCDGRTMTYRTTRIETLMFSRVQGWDTTDGTVHSQVPGSVGLFQHLRQFPYYDKNI